jgi:hypothetical protein
MRKTNPRPTGKSAQPPSGRTPLEGHGAAPVQLRLKCQPLPQVRFRLARGSDAPSSGTPPRSGAERPLARGPVSIESQAPPRASFCLAREHHGPTASIPAPPAGAFNALTSAGTQVKGESTPLRAWESCPALLRQLPWRGHPRHYATLCNMVSNNPMALCHPLLYGRRAAPSRKDGGALEGKVNSYAAPVQR